MTSLELAIKVVNLRKALETANKCLVEDGKFGVLCNENQGPRFEEGRHFWAEVHKLIREE